MLSIIIKRIFGVSLLLIGASLGVWFIYNQFWPTDEFKSGFRSVLQLALPFACLIVGWKWMRCEGKGIEEITPPDLNCLEMEASVKAARESMHTFLAEVEKGVDGAFVKFPLQTPQGLTEHIWAYVHFFRDGRFNVSLANDPFDNQMGSEGRRDVPLAEVEDWQIMQPDGNIRGAHSLIALFRHYENRGVKLSPRMKKQKAQLMDAF
jgi:hypothetical protein